MQMIQMTAISPSDVLPHLGWPFVLLALVVLGLVVLRWWLTQHGADSANVTMQRRPLMTPGELAFFTALEPAVSQLSRVFVQVPLAALIDFRSSDGSARTAANNRIDRKIVDFVLVNPKSLDVQAVVELDDRSHILDHRRARDEVVEHALKKAGIQIIRFPAQASYNSDQIRERITKALATS
jgi:very-short-patch-repair endonuclease